MRRIFRFSRRRVITAGVTLTVFLGFMVLLDRRYGGFDKVPYFSVERVLRGSTVSADMPLGEIERRLANLLTVESPAGRQAALSFSLDECTAAYRIEHGREVCEAGASWWKREIFYDLRLLKTAPQLVRIRGLEGARHTSPEGRVETYPDGTVQLRWLFRDDAAERLLALRGQSMRIPQDERAGESRRQRFDRRRRSAGSQEGAQEGQASQLNDRLRKASYQRTHYCSGLKLDAPRSSVDVRHHVYGETAEDVIDMMHAYASRVCPFDPAALQ